MSTLLIREYTSLAIDQSGKPMPIAVEGDGTRDQAVTYTTSSQSAAFNKSTKYIEIVSKTAFHYKVGSNPTATTSNMYLAAGVSKFIGLQDGDLKIAAIDAT